MLEYRAWSIAIHSFVPISVGNQAIIS